MEGGRRKEGGDRLKKFECNRFCLGWEWGRDEGSDRRRDVIISFRRTRMITHTHTHTHRERERERERGREREKGWLRGCS